MRPDALRCLATALVLIAGQGAVQPGAAAVVHDNGGTPSIPAVETAGRYLPRGPLSPTPYGMIKAIAKETRPPDPMRDLPPRSIPLIPGASRS